MSPLPLEGIRVLDLSRLLPGPFCSQLLADLGADVIKVEDPQGGDPARWLPPHYEGADPSASSALFLALNRNKRSVTLDLKSPAGREAFLALVDSADVLLESFRPGVLERLGVGWSTLSNRKESLVYCAITGFGQEGPGRDRSGHDLNYLGLTGALALTGDRDGPPTQPAAQIADIGGGALMAALGILAALRERDRSGHGQFVDVSMVHGTMSWLAMQAGAMACTGIAPRRGVHELTGGVLCYRPYRCADGWVTLAALEHKFWKNFCDGVSRPDLLMNQFDPPGSVAHQVVEQLILGGTRAEWVDFGARHDCCLEAVLDLEEAMTSDYVISRGLSVELKQPGAVGPVTVLGPPIGFSRTPADPHRLPAPALGEHNDELLPVD